jgi:uncharacterized protein YdhG (YjbR/CyaY superfamily)
MSDQTAQTYLEAAPEPQRTTLLTMWATLRRLLPDAEVTVSYGVPTLKVGGKGVAGVAHYAKHCSYLPMSGSVTAKLGDQLGSYRTSKGAVMMPVDQPLPEELLITLVDARLAELGHTR